jgi:hypothetical protein
MRSILPLLLLIALAAPALAVDGVLEINQTCAVETGCFAGDFPGYPVQISQSGSYRLTSDLTSSTVFTGISVNADHVTIDLNGFSIIGPGTGTSGSGIIASTGADSTAVLNGRVIGLGSDGIRLRDDARIVGVHVEGSGAGSFVRSGIVVGERSTVRGCTSHANTGWGISASSGSTVAESVATSNGEIGISVIVAGSIVDNTVIGNGQAGVRSGNGGTVSGNVISDNLGLGIECLANAGYAGNVLTRNNGSSSNPQVHSSCVELGANYCGNSTTCP